MLLNDDFISKLNERFVIGEEIFLPIDSLNSIALVKSRMDNVVLDHSVWIGEEISLPIEIML